MSGPSKAIFLSYASQDTEAAQLLCESLRRGGIEVWFDSDGGLEHGDEWDQKIRRQIKECLLFIAVISANTQARQEGYFRLEWELAAQRAMSIASGVAFILPIVIDATREPDALVPDRFRAVQWMRLPKGEVSPEVQQRFLKLWSHRAGVIKNNLNPPPLIPEDQGSLPTATLNDGPKNKIWLKAGIATLLIASLGLLWWQPWRASERTLKSAALLTNDQVATVAIDDFPRDPDLKRALDMINGVDANAEDFAFAEDLVKEVLAKRPMDVEGITVMARVQDAYLYRGFDRSDTRRAAAQRYAQRAVRLAPNDPEALAALGIYYFARSADLSRARELLTQAIALKPRSSLFYHFRDEAMFRDPKFPRAEAVAAAEETTRRFPNNALIYYQLARVYRDVGRLEDMERALDRSIAITPIANAMMWKSRLALWVRGDLAEMKALLDRVPPRTNDLERVCFTKWTYAMAAGNPAFGLTALTGITNPWFEDFDFIGPRQLLAAQLLELGGQHELARLQYEAALLELRQQKTRSPGDASLPNLETWIYYGLDQMSEARASNKIASEAVTHPYRYATLQEWWFTAIPINLLLGERATALQLIREAVTVVIPSANDPTQASRLAREALRLRFRLDPRMAPYREDPEIIALLGESVQPVAARPLSEGAQLAERAKAIYARLSYTVSDLGPAEDLARRATERDPDNATIWGVRAGVQAAWVSRNWDLSEKRQMEVQRLANHALTLDPNEPEALLALAHLLKRNTNTVEQAVTDLRRAVAANPTHIRLARALGSALNATGRTEEGRKFLLDLTKVAPRDPLLHYELALSYSRPPTGSTSDSAEAERNFAQMLKHLDEAIAIQPFGHAITMKANLVANLRGDLPAARLIIDQLATLPLADRAEDRSVATAMWVGLLERLPEQVEAAAALTTRNYFTDAVLLMAPKAWSLALAHQIAGKVNRARADWQSAEILLRQLLKDDQTNQVYQVELATTLAWLGQNDEAEALVRSVEPLWKEDLGGFRVRLLAGYYGARGDATKAAPYLTLGLNSNNHNMTTHTLRLNPWWDKLRGQPEFEKLLKAPATKL